MRQTIAMHGPDAPRADFIRSGALACALPALILLLTSP
jgi:hypothetical protein